MERSRILFVVLAITAVAAVSTAGEAQTAQDLSIKQPRQGQKAAQRPMTFPPDSEASGTATSIEFRPYGQMTQQDQDLAMNAEPVIGERAGFAGLEFNEGKWNSRQIVCSALPNHLFLQFMRNNGTGDVSVFSASIPRGGEGQVRIIPILRRGYSLFSPAPINALTISVFNHIRAEEQPEKAAEWLATGLCYAALAGAHPQIGPAEVTEIQKLPTAPPGMLMIPSRGGAVISFTDRSATPRPMEWTMTFNDKGKLLKATYFAAHKSKEKVVARAPVEVHGMPTHASDANAKTTRIE
jgi:hypothetical protein